MFGVTVDGHHRVFAFATAAAFESAITADAAVVIFAGEAAVGKTCVVQEAWPRRAASHRTALMMSQGGDLALHPTSGRVTRGPRARTGGPDQAVQEDTVPAPILR